MGLFSGGAEASASITETIKDIAQLSGGISQTVKGNELSRMILDDITQGLATFISTGGRGQYSKEQAIADSEMMMTNAINSALASGAPAVNKVGASAGAYDNTTQQMMANDLTASAAASGAKVQSQAIQDYAQIVTQSANIALDSLMNALKLEQSAFTETKKLDALRRHEESTSTTYSGKMSSDKGALDMFSGF